MGEIPGYQALLDGRIMEAVAKPHTAILGDMFYAVLLCTGLTVLYMKTENFPSTMIVGATVSAGIQTLLPTESLALFGLATVFAFSAVIYGVATR